MDQDSRALYRKALFLEYVTVGYNIVEAVLSIFFGNAASSIALISFGLDSVVESLSGSILIWRLRVHGNIPSEEEELIEERSRKLVAVTFLLLGIYVVFESLTRLINGEISRPSPIGMIIALCSIVVMPILAWRKHRIGTAIGSAALVADSKETITCAFLSVALLIGLGANYFFGFWQADPVIGLFIAVFLFFEGYESWNESDDD